MANGGRVYTEPCFVVFWEKPFGLLSGCINCYVFEYFGGVVMCSEPSIEPKIQNSDIVFAENFSRHFYGIQRGDTVIAKSLSDPKSNICKRVTGLEGDKILINSPSGLFKSHSYVPTGHVWLEDLDSMILDFYMTVLMATDFLMIGKHLFF
ncbi:hypothetical protein E2I00_000858 [Balaenoptera physalus]|uniref:Peptidase S26 domain-containing protein n=1 Tax=Balaenoptera physalus TaxID=9770 RepID=A0A643CB55_BALPH|nr:hypothetical protein E2I00_000858 [Balaenoptera physalus]